MAIVSPPLLTTTSTGLYPPQLPQRFSQFNPKPSTSLSSLPLRIHLHHPFPLPSTNPNPRHRLCHAALSPQPPPQSDQPPENDPVRPRGAGVAANFSRFQDRVQIFFAVLFWMSLFFWASVWDDRNNGRGRISKGSRFRR